MDERNTMIWAPTAMHSTGTSWKKVVVRSDAHPTWACVQRRAGGCELCVEGWRNASCAAFTRCADAD